MTDSEDLDENELDITESDRIGPETITVNQGCLPQFCAMRGPVHAGCLRIETEHGDVVVRGEDGGLKIEIEDCGSHEI